MEVESYIGGIKGIIEKGGPEPSEYEYVVNVPDLNGIPLHQEALLHETLKPILDENSLLGHTYHKPYGYAGDFELIDRLYTKWMSPDKTYHKWDNLYHTLDAATAVRNRKDYFQKLMINHKSSNSKLEILDLGSGPCRDIEEFLSSNPRQDINIDCLDMDKTAIEYARGVCDNHIDKINFINKNAFRFKAEKEYNLIWSAGLFDYFSDKLFIRLVNRMYQLVASGGELVIGNFSYANSSKNLMETFGQWYLNHRSGSLLIELAMQAGVPKSKIYVDEESTGVNLFIHMEK